jgi:hypothetical protein
MFNVDFDTGSADIWIPSSQCEYACGLHPKFYSNRSSSYRDTGNKTWTIQYGDGSGVNGFTGNDIIHLGKNLSQLNQTIGFATQLSQGLATDQYLDGIFGLGFPNLSFTGVKETVVEKLYTVKKISAPVVSFFLGKSRDGGKGEVVSVSFFFFFFFKKKKKDKCLTYELPTCYFDRHLFS